MPIPTTPGTHGRVLTWMAAIAAIVVTISLGATAAPAHAESNESIKVAGGKVSFIGHGNGLAAKDSRKDGYCMVARLRYRYFDELGNIQYGFYGTAACGAGKGNLRRLPLAEGTKVEIQACYGKNGKSVRCSDFQRATA